jgi:mono/diheme cytochrome c family protein
MNRLVFLLAFALACIQFANSSSRVATQADTTDAALREQGKKIFVARCAQCHDADASKKLSDGTTLLQRLAARTDPEARLGTRLKQPQERHAVMVYIESLLKPIPSPRAGRRPSSPATR